MRKWLSRLHEWATRDRVGQFHDPVLGELLLDETDWGTTIESPTGPITIWVGGRYEPDERVLETARETVENRDEFLAGVRAFLHAESEKFNTPKLRPLMDEVRALKVHDVNYWWPKHPRSGMIFFDGPDECRLWHCDIQDGELSSLVFDT